MADTSIKSSLETTLATLKQEFDLNNHTFFINMKNAKYSPMVVGRIMMPFYFAVHHWVEHLKEFSSVPETIPVSRNIRDELGYQPDGTRDLNKMHTVTFVNFLMELGYSAGLAITPPVKKFNKQLDDLLHGDPAFHAFVLGGIEHFYVTISDWICMSLQTNYNIMQQHYQTHQVIDQQHADDFFRIGFALGCGQATCEKGIRTGYQMLWNVFQELVAEYENSETSTENIYALFENLV